MEGKSSTRSVRFEVPVEEEINIAALTKIIETVLNSVEETQSDV